ncbi:hypothetical protein X474_18730 [Dethiosulfatarculus sandiegensis]|uniref:Uncharacterized protein n=1 Tax=Dethiosulfatarculus sandiegensis TaxID=1429043 RepID=A0A0D2JA06_9BACT|nr:hypothetical protein X474_18730 [Dethiosulfatarculus sandiegensis]
MAHLSSKLFYMGFIKNQTELAGKMNLSLY